MNNIELYLDRHFYSKVLIVNIDNVRCWVGYHPYSLNCNFRTYHNLKLSECDKL